MIFYVPMDFPLFIREIFPVILELCSPHTYTMIPSPSGQIVRDGFADDQCRSYRFRP